MFEVDRLIILGGPSCSGKSTLERSIKYGEKPFLRKQLKIDAPSRWYYLKAGDINKIEAPKIDKLIVHYDFYSQFSKINGFKNLEGLVKNSSETTVMTLCTPVDILIKRNAKRMKDILANGESLSQKIARLRWLWRMNRFFKDGVSIYSLYQEWFNFFENSGKNLKLEEFWLHLGEFEGKVMSFV